MTTRKKQKTREEIAQEKRVNKIAEGLNKLMSNKKAVK